MSSVTPPPARRTLPDLRQRSVLAGEAAAVAISAIAVILVAMLGLDLLGRRLTANVLPWRI